MTTDQPLTCAICGGPLSLADAAAPPEGIPERMYFHRDLADCWAARKARALAWHPGKHGLNNPPYVWQPEVGE